MSNIIHDDKAEHEKDLEVILEEMSIVYQRSLCNKIIKISFVDIRTQYEKEHKSKVVDHRISYGGGKASDALDLLIKMIYCYENKPTSVFIITKNLKIEKKENMPIMDRMEMSISGYWS